MKTIFLFAFLCMTVFSSRAEIVVVMSAKATVSNLDKDKISAIFLGKTSTFPDGNPAEPIEQTEDTVAREEFHRVITEKSSSQLKSYWSKMVFSGKGNPPKEAPNSAEVLKLIAANPRIIGYMEKSEINSTLKVVFAP